MPGSAGADRGLQQRSPNAASANGSPLALKTGPLAAQRYPPMRIFSPSSPTPLDNQRVTKLVSVSFACIVLAFVFSVLSYGQSGSGTIKGTVLDQSGAAIGGATV